MRNWSAIYGIIDAQQQAIEPSCKLPLFVSLHVGEKATFLCLVV